MEGGFGVGLPQEVALKFSGSLRGSFERLNAIPKGGGLFVISFAGGGLHLLLQFPEPFFCLALQKLTGRFQSLVVIRFAYLIGVSVNFRPGVIVETP